MPSSFVRRSSTTSPTGWSWVGPIRSAAQAKREQQAWADTGATAEVLPATPEVWAEVRAWEQAKRPRIRPGR